MSEVLNWVDSAQLLFGLHLPHFFLSNCHTSIILSTQYLKFNMFFSPNTTTTAAVAANTTTSITTTTTDATTTNHSSKCLLNVYQIPTYFSILNTRHTYPHTNVCH
jgi:hypothetical protein